MYQTISLAGPTRTVCEAELFPMERWKALKILSISRKQYWKPPLNNCLFSSFPTKFIKKFGQTGVLFWFKIFSVNCYLPNAHVFLHFFFHDWNLNPSLKSPWKNLPLPSKVCVWEEGWRDWDPGESLPFETCPCSCVLEVPVAQCCKALRPSPLPRLLTPKDVG